MCTRLRGCAVSCAVSNCAESANRRPQTTDRCLGQGSERWAAGQTMTGPAGTPEGGRREVKLASMSISQRLLLRARSPGLKSGARPLAAGGGTTGAQIGLFYSESRSTRLSSNDFRIRPKTFSHVPAGRAFAPKRRRAPQSPIRFPPWPAQQSAWCRPRVHRSIARWT